MSVLEVREGDVVLIGLRVDPSDGGAAQNLAIAKVLGEALNVTCRVVTMDSTVATVHVLRRWTP